MRRKSGRFSKPPIETVSARNSIPAVESIRGDPIQFHGLQNLCQNYTADSMVVNTMWRIARMASEDFATMTEYVSALMEEFKSARSCRIYVSPKNTVTDLEAPQFEHRLTVVRGLDQGFIGDETPTSVKPADDPRLGPIIAKAFTSRQVIMLDHDVGIRINANLDMDSDRCDVYPIDRIQGQNSIAIVPFYYRDAEHPSGIVVLEGDLGCKDSNLEGFAKSFWAMKTAMTAAPQIALQLTHKFDTITILTKTADFNVDFRNGVEDLLGGETKSLYLLLIDLDDFKGVNDRYSYETGNAVLRQTASRMRESVRNGDVVSRWGGEEFVVLLEDVTKEEAMHIAERIRTNVGESTVCTSKGDIRVTCSIGVSDVGLIAEHVRATVGSGTADIIDLISTEAFDMSDLSLKASKKMGKNRSSILPYACECINTLQ